MCTTLITFLGRQQIKKGQEGYRLTNYRIGEQVYANSAFVGFNLQQHLNTQRLVVLGTAGSMWDHLFEGDIDFADQHENERMALAQAVEDRCVDQTLLDKMSPLLAAHLGIQVTLQLIPMGNNLEEQVTLVDCMARHVDKGDQVYLDITHGLRSLPMVALLAAMYLRTLREADIKSIWYAAFELKEDDITPVNNLSGLLTMADWLEAMHAYSKDGDYSVFSQLLGKGGEQLQAAAFFERTNNSAKAQQKLTSWSLNNELQDPVARLFEPELTQRINWYKQTSRYKREQILAWEYLKRKDYLRASILALEAKISEQLYLDQAPDDFNNRDEAGDKLRAHNKAFQTLNRLRNALAHGVRSSNKDIDRLLSNESTLADKLRELFKALQIQSR